MTHLKNRFPDLTAVDLLMLPGHVPWGNKVRKMMIKNSVCCALSAGLVGLSQVSAAQQAAPPTTPSPEMVEKRLDSRQTPLPRPSYAAPPSTKRIENLLALKLPWVWRVDSVAIEKSENLGTAGAPLYKQRFEARISLKENLYEAVGDPLQASDHRYESAYQPGNKRVVRTIAKAGDSYKLVGVANSVFLNGQYNTFFEFENLPAEKGRALKDFEGEALVQGSPEEREFTAERERQRRDDYLTHKKEKAKKHREAEEEARHHAVEEARRRAAEAEAARKAAQ